MHAQPDFANQPSELSQQFCEALLLRRFVEVDRRLLLILQHRNSDYIDLMDAEDALVDVCLNGNKAEQSKAFKRLETICAHLGRTEQEPKRQLMRVHRILARVLVRQEKTGEAKLHFEEYFRHLKSVDKRMSLDQLMCREYVRVYPDKWNWRMPEELKIEVSSAAEFVYPLTGYGSLNHLLSFDENSLRYLSLRTHYPLDWPLLDTLNYLFEKAGDFRPPPREPELRSGVASPLPLTEEDDVDQMHRPDLAAIYDSKALQCELCGDKENESEIVRRFARVINRYVKLGDFRQARYWLLRLSMQKISILDNETRLKILKSMRDAFRASDDLRQVLHLRQFGEIEQKLVTEPTSPKELLDLECLKEIENIYRSVGEDGRAGAIEAQRLDRWWFKLKEKNKVLYEFVGSDFLQGTLEHLDQTEKLFAGAEVESKYDDRFRALTGISSICDHCYLLTPASRSLVAERVLKIAHHSAAQGDRPTVFWLASSATCIYGATDPVNIASKAMDIVDLLDQKGFKKEAEMLVKQLKERLNEEPKDLDEKRAIEERINKRVTRLTPLPALSNPH